MPPAYEFACPAIRPVAISLLFPQIFPLESFAPRCHAWHFSATRTAPVVYEVIYEEDSPRSSFSSGYLLVFNTQLFGWVPVGHMAVAYIAYNRLTPATKSRVEGAAQAKSRLQQMGGEVPAGTAQKFQVMMIFMIASTWPDQIKSKAGYTDDGPDPHGNRPDGASSSLNIGYSDHLHHKYWHFVDRPFTQDGTSPLPSNSFTQRGDPNRNFSGGAGYDSGG